MKNIVIPGSVWVIVIAILNAVPAALMQAYPQALWVPIVVDAILVITKAIQVYAPKTEQVISGDMVAPAAAPAPVQERGATSRFLFG